MDSIIAAARTSNRAYNRLVSDLYNYATSKASAFLREAPAALVSRDLTRDLVHTTLGIKEPQKPTDEPPYVVIDRLVHTRETVHEIKSEICRLLRVQQPNVVRTGMVASPEGRSSGIARTRVLKQLHMRGIDSQMADCQTWKDIADSVKLSVATVVSVMNPPRMEDIDNCAASPDVEGTVDKHRMIGQCRDYCAQGLSRRKRQRGVDMFGGELMDFMDPPPPNLDGFELDHDAIRTTATSLVNAIEAVVSECSLTPAEWVQAQLALVCVLKEARLQLASVSPATLAAATVRPATL